jgi:hypothetical protein
MSSDAETSVLDDASAVYRPFSVAESNILRAFAHGARRLAQMQFFDEVPTRAVVRGDQATGLTAAMDEPDDEALRAALTEFRQLYSHKEPHCFHRVMALLKRSAYERNGPHRAEAIEALDDFTTASRSALTGAGVVGVAIVVEDAASGEKRPMPPERIIDAYLHGHYFHSGNDKSRVATELDNIPALARFTFYSALLALRNLYWTAANAVDRVLAVDSLLDGP